ncbi:unnamed protein product [Diamesa serratosioi]
MNSDLNLINKKFYNDSKYFVDNRYKRKSRRDSAMTSDQCSVPNKQIREDKTMTYEEFCFWHKETQKQIVAKQMIANNHDNLTQKKNTFKKMKLSRTSSPSFEFCEHCEHDHDRADCCPFVFDKKEDLYRYSSFKKELDQPYVISDISEFEEFCKQHGRSTPWYFPISTKKCLDAEKKQPEVIVNTSPVVYIRQYCYPVMVQVPNQNIQQISHPVMQQFSYPTINPMSYQFVQPTTYQQYYQQNYLQPVAGNYIPRTSYYPNYTPEIIVKQMQICLSTPAPLTYQEPKIIESHNFVQYNQLTGTYYTPLNGFAYS